VVRALVKDGWTITDDPLTIEYEGLYLFIDLGGERAVTARRGTDRIAVEIKSFPHRSVMENLHPAVGQFVIYRTFLRELDPQRELYLAVSRDTYDYVFTRPAVAFVRTKLAMPLVVVDVPAEEIVTWIK
jgi:hypothetical protein